MLTSHLLHREHTSPRSIPSTPFTHNDHVHGPTVRTKKAASISSLELSFLASPVSAGGSSHSGSSTHSAHPFSACTMRSDYAYPQVGQGYDLDISYPQMPWSMTSSVQDQNAYYGQMFHKTPAVDQTSANATMPNSHIDQGNSAAALGFDLGHYLFQQTQRKVGMGGIIQPDLLDALGAPFPGPEKLNVDLQKSQQQIFDPMIIESDPIVEFEGDAEGEKEDDRLTEYHGSPSRSASPSLSSYLAWAISPHTSRTQRHRSNEELQKASQTKYRRKKTWSAGLLDPEPFDRDTRERTIELLRAESGGSVIRKDKRRLRNRLAQRAFRARSKVHKQELSDYMIHLETLTEAQEKRLLKMHAHIERLQKENTCFKLNSWQPIQAGGSGAGALPNKLADD